MSDGSRRAALALHALGGEDRAWILARLAEGERHEIDALLAELRELGIPAMGEELARLAASAPAPANARERVRAADARAIARVIAAEPDAIVVRLLSIEGWPWRDALLRRLPRRRRDAIRRGLGDAPGCGGSLARLLVESTDRRLAARPSLRLIPWRRR